MADKGIIDSVNRLIGYALGCGLIENEDRTYVSNGIFDVLRLEPEDSYDADSIAAEGEDGLEEILAKILDYAVENGIIENGIASRDIFDTRLMGILMPRPSEVIRHFFELYRESPERATDWFYKLCCDCDYIRRYRIEKDKKWLSSTEYGDLDITINLSKPEKDPKAIAAALSRRSDSYPKCLLCHANEGYAGRLDHPARENLRQIPLTLGNEQWYMQYSPYVYYNEHCIVLSKEHRPMKIDRMTFVRLFDFIDRFPHYTIGSNADLPIVGGSILTHEHYQGGRYEFAMERAGLRQELSFEGFDDVKCGIVNWPMSVIRLDGKDRERIIRLADKILDSWRGYSDDKADILAETDGNPHNTITPIARMRGDMYELDLVLRNNRTTEEYPLGIFHPHDRLHHIKKENIGLIEVMGLAVLPARLLEEMELLKKAILEGRDVASDDRIASHADWVGEIMEKHSDINASNIDEIINTEIGLVFSEVLKDAGVYKDTPEGHEAFKGFVDYVNRG